MRPYAPNRRKVTQLWFAGIVASLGMVALSLLLGDARWPSVGWRFLAGAFILPLAEDYLADRQVLPNVRWLKGAIWGALLWLVADVILNPLLGGGFFSRGAPNSLSMAFLSLVCWLTYGLLFDGITRRVRLVHEILK